MKLGAEGSLTEGGGLSLLSFPRLADPKVLYQAVTTRLGGVSLGPRGALNLSLKVGDEEARVRENRLLLSRATGVDWERAVTLDQVHGDKVLKLEGDMPQARAGGSLGEGDGIITRVPGVPILILVADCLPVLFYDPVHRAIGLAHAGWRGTVSHVAAKTLLAMGEAYGTEAQQVRAVLGPAIGSCCYEVGENVKKELDQVFPWAGEVLRPGAGSRWKLDLEEANARQLMELGVSGENLVRSGLCTVQNMKLFFSHRVEAAGGGAAGRIGVLLMLRG